MTEYVPKAIQAWQAMSDNDKAFLEKVATFTDDIADLPSTLKNALARIYDKLPNNAKDLYKEDFTGLKGHEILALKLEEIDNILERQGIIFEQDKGITDAEKTKIYNEWNNSDNTDYEVNNISKSLKKYNKQYKEDRNNAIDAIDMAVPTSLKVLDINKLKNNEYNINDFTEAIKRLEELKNTNTNIKQTPSNYFTKVLTTLYKNISIINKINEVKDNIQSDWNTGKYEDFQDVLDKYIKNPHSVINPLSDTEGYKAYPFIVGRDKGETYKQYIYDTLIDMRGYLNKMYNPTQPMNIGEPIEELTEEEAKRKQYINNFNKLSDDDKKLFKAWLPTFNTSTKTVEDKNFGRLRSIFHQIIGDNSKRRDDIKADDKREVIKSIGDYIYTQSPAFNERIESLSKDFDNITNDIVNSSIQDNFDSLEALNPAMIKSVQPIKDIDDIEIAANMFEGMPTEPTEPIEPTEPTDAIVAIPNSSVPTVIADLANDWMTRDKLLTDVLTDTEKVISILTTEQYDKIEDDLATQLMLSSDDAGNKLFNDKGEVIKFLRSLRSKRQGRYRLPQPIERIEKRNTGLNYNLSPMLLRNRRYNTKSYRFYNE